MNHTDETNTLRVGGGGEQITDLWEPEILPS